MSGGVILAVSAILGCAGAQADPNGSGATTSQPGAAPPGVRFAVVPAKPRFGPGEPVKAVLRVVNESEETVRFAFRSGCQASFEVERDGRTLFHHRFHVMCTMALTVRELAPGQSVEFPFTWDRVDDEGAPVSRGAYQIVGYLADGNGPRVAATVELE
ncbi:MAG: BsuPI-related putative proteinase inhibitor [Gemmatimonadales bacterium]